MTQQVIDFLNRRENFEEAAEVTTYQVYAHSRPVTVEVHDAGLGADNLRYTVAAYWSSTPEDQRHTGTDGYTLGNPGATLADALDGPHWWIFRAED
ncbi:MAG: hypothetical protein K0S70_1007 [Microbacterium sp.]|jgi:hypothetical protein|nr:hypothetical protein [Microbacterium sp.]